MLLTAVPQVIHEAGERASFPLGRVLHRRAGESTYPARHTAGSVAGFCDWCAIGRVPLPTLTSPLVTAYYHELFERLSPASANQHLSGIRQWLEWLAQRRNAARLWPPATGGARSRAERRSRSGQTGESRTARFEDLRTAERGAT